METYSKVFAEVYDTYWTGFAKNFAPPIFALFEERLGGDEKHLLDLGCGTGTLSRHFLERGYQVTAIDQSDAMLDRARLNCRGASAPGKQRFVAEDLASLAPVDPPADCAVSLFDTLNHLPDGEALESVVSTVAASLRPGGVFVFDLNTRRGLARWNGINYVEESQAVFINRGVYQEGMVRAATRITGFVRRRGRLFERFEEVFYNTVFEMETVRDLLNAAGFDDVLLAGGGDLKTALPIPEDAGRVFFVAQKGSGA